MWQNGCRTENGQKVENLHLAGIDMEGLNVNELVNNTYESFRIFSFNQNIMDSTISTIDNSDPNVQKVIVSFCAVFDNKYGDMIVNFDQISITMTIQINSQFTVEGFDAKVRTPVVSDGNTLQYSVSASLCSAPSGPTFNQGQVVDICICTGGFPAVEIKGIRSMKFTASNNLNQESIDASGVAGFLSTLGEPYLNPAMTHSCIQVSTLPSQQFYTSSNVVSVTVTGRAVLEFSTQGTARHLRATNRSLREQEEPFQLQVVLIADPSSRAGRWLVRIIPLVAAAGLLL